MHVSGRFYVFMLVCRDTLNRVRAPRGNSGHFVTKKYCMISVDGKVDLP